MTREVETDDPPLQEAARPRGRRRWIRLAVVLAVVALLVFASQVLDVGQYLREMRGFIERLGPWGPIAFVLIYILANLAMVPAWPLTVLAGVLFHWIEGTIYVSIGATIGAAACFLIARYVAHDLVAAWMAPRPTFRKLNDLTHQHGAWIVAITRLVPIFPYNLINYAFGLTAVSFGTYVFWSWLCMLPWAAVYVIGGDAIRRFLEEQQVPWPLLGGLTVLIALVMLATWYGRKQWKAAAARRRARRAAAGKGAGRLPREGKARSSEEGEATA